MSEESKRGLGSRLLPFIAPAVEITITLLLKPGGVAQFVAIGLAVALMAVAFDLSGLDKNLLLWGRHGCPRCRGVDEGFVVFTATIIFVVAASWVPVAGSQNPGVPLVLFAVGAVLIGSIVRHGYRHRVKGMPRDERASWLTGFLSGYLAALAITYGLLLLY